MRDLLAQALGELRHEPTERRVRASLGAAGDRRQHAGDPRLGAAPRRARRSPCRPRTSAPSWRRRPRPNGDVAGILHPGIPFAVHTAAGEPVSIEDREGAGFRLADADLAGYVALDFDAFDEW